MDTMGMLLQAKSHLGHRSDISCHLKDAHSSTFTYTLNECPQNACKSQQGHFMYGLPYSSKHPRGTLICTDGDHNCPGILITASCKGIARTAKVAAQAAIKDHSKATRAGSRLTHIPGQGM